MSILLNQGLVGFGAGQPRRLPLTNLLARWRADTGVTEAAGLVSSWVDSINGHDLVGATNKPLYQTSRVNGQPAILFDGTNDSLRVGSGFTLAQPFHMFAVIRQVSWAASRNFCDGASNFRYMQQKNTTPECIQGAGITSVNSIDGGNGVPAVGAASDFWLFSSFFNGASSYNQCDDSAAVSGGNPGTGGYTGSFTMGSQDDQGSRFCNFEVAEWLAYSAEVSGGYLTELRDYMKERYAIPGIA